jgi:hypothetical protein
VSALLLEEPRMTKPQIETYSGFARRSLNDNYDLTTIPIFDMGTTAEKVRLRKPVAVRVSIEEGSIFVENETLRLFGSGRNLAEAISEFRSDLLSIWRYYTSLSDDQLIGHALELKATLLQLAA